MKVLITGSAGLIGSNVVAAANERGWDVVATYHRTDPSVDVETHQLDIRDADSATSLFVSVDPDAVIHCAAMTDVDDCESDPELAFEVNGTALADLAEAAVGVDSQFIHVSTDYVFNGDSNSPYLESDEPNPIQVYGETKLAGERAVQRIHPNPTIPRLSFVYGINQSNHELKGFPAWLRQKLLSEEQVPLFTDQRITPTRAGYAAEAILELLTSQVTGIVHVASRSCITPYEFGRKIADEIGISTDFLVEGSQEAVDRPAERPSFSCLSSERLAEVLSSPVPTVEEDLQAIADELQAR